MPETLHMLELPLDPDALIRFAQDHGVNRNRDEDLGYALHAWLKALLNDMAPKPFRLLTGRQPRLLGYTTHTGEALLEHALTYASPQSSAVSDLHNLANAKPMPTVWRSGRELGFEVLLCPTSRLHGAEKDRYRHLLEHRDTHPVSEQSDQTPPTREAVYRAWLMEQMGQTARLKSAHMERFQFVSQYRKGLKKKLDRPQALFRGILEVQDSSGMNSLLSRGIGRHRAFGYGMLLLRPT